MGKDCDRDETGYSPDEYAGAGAVAVHNSQGSEYPAEAIPLLTQHYAMLKRNLLYTGVTSGKGLAVLED